jgi:hypothetical protein
MSDLELFDANVSIGRPAHPHFGSWLEVDGLVAEMDRFGISRALVGHVWSSEISTVAGNHALSQALRDHQRLIPLWSMIPNCEDLGRSVSDQLAAVINYGAGAVRIDPWPTQPIHDGGEDPRDYTLTDTAVSELCSALEAIGIPLFIDINRTDWHDVYRLCTDHTDLAIVIQNLKFMHQRSLFAGLRAFDNLHVEISGYHAHRGIEDLHSAFGSRQILFGTRLPTFTAAAAVSMLGYVDIPEESRQAISSGNLERLLHRGRASWANL